MARWTQTFEERFWSKVDKTSSCWVWTAALTNRGYGNFRVPTGNLVAHRVAYELEVGPIPDGLFLDHLCRNRRCVNPEHLEPVTCAENVARGLGPIVTKARHRTQTHCKHGHPLFGANVILRADGTGRQCRECQRRFRRAYLERKKAQS